MPKDPSASYKSRDRGPVEFESKLHEEEGEIMDIASEDVITISTGLPIKDATEKMVENGIRRLPVTDPGTRRLKGMLVTRDIVNFLGGGEKHQIIENKHSGNFLSAINDSTERIMNSNPPYTTNKSSISKAAQKMKDEGVGGLPILDKDKKIVGIVSERDLTGYMPSPAKAKVENYMTQNVTTLDPDVFLAEAMKEMISKGFRRLPVVENDDIIGIITSVDVLDYFGSSEMFKNMSSGNAADALHVEIKKIMTEDPLCCGPGDDVGNSARKMKESGFGGLPVTENGNLIGIITERDIIEALL